MRARAPSAGVALCVIPAVAAFNFDDGARTGASPGRRLCAGHPSAVHRPGAATSDLQAARCRTRTRAATTRAWWPSARSGSTSSSRPGRRRSRRLLSHPVAARAQARPAGDHPCAAFGRPGAQASAAGRRRAPWHGIAHAFNGSEQQAQACIDLGLKLGFGGAVTFERALQLRRLAADAAAGGHRDGDRCARHPAALALPHAGAARRRASRRAATSRRELPRIAAVVAGLRGIEPRRWRDATTRNAVGGPASSICADRRVGRRPGARRPSARLAPRALNAGFWCHP